MSLFDSAKTGILHRYVVMIEHGAIRKWAPIRLLAILVTLVLFACSSPQIIVVTATPRPPVRALETPTRPVATPTPRPTPTATPTPNPTPTVDPLLRDLMRQAFIAVKSQYDFRLNCDVTETSRNEIRGACTGQGTEAFLNILVLYTISITGAGRSNVNMYALYSISGRDAVAFQQCRGIEGDACTETIVTLEDGLRRIESRAKLWGMK